MNRDVLSETLLPTVDICVAGGSNIKRALFSRCYEKNARAGEGWLPRYRLILASFTTDANHADFRELEVPIWWHGVED